MIRKRIKHFMLDCWRAVGVVREDVFVWELSLGQSALL